MPPFLRLALAASAAWIAVRALAVLALSEVFFFGEEREKGAVAVLLRGWWSGEGGLPWTSLPYHPYEGGGFVASHVKALAFALVGENLLAHKLAALLWGALVLVALLAFVWRHLGPSSARWCAALLVFAPEHVQRESLLHLGIHFEALVFVGLLFSGALDCAREPRLLRWPKGLVLGAVAGFGLWFSLQLALPLALVAVVSGVSAWRARAGAGFVGAAAVGFALGAAPLAVLAHAVGRGVFDVHGAEVGGPGGFTRLAGFLASAARGAAAEPLVLAQSLALAAAALVGLAAALARATTRAAGALCAAYLALWLVAAGWSGLVPERLGHWFGLLRWAPPVVFGLVLAAHGLAVATGGPAGSASAARRWWGFALALGALGGGVAATGRIVGEGELSAARANLAVLRAAPGVAWAEAFGKLAPRWRIGPEGPLSGEAAALAAFGAHVAALGPRADAAALWTGFAAGSAVGDERPLAAALAALRAGLPPEAGPWLPLGLGALAARDAGLTEGWRALAAAPPDLDPTIAEALGRYGSGGGLHPAFAALEAQAVRGHPAAPAYLRGLGARAVDALVLGPYGGLGGLRLTLRPAAARAWLADALADEDRDSALAGFDAALALRFRR